MFNVADVLSAGAGWNVTTILLLIQQLRPEQLSELFKQLGVRGKQELQELLSYDERGRTEQLPYEQRLLQYEDYRTHKILKLYSPPVILIVGTIGNLLTFLVLMRRPMRKYSTYIYLAVLSVTDTLVLYVGLLRLWLAEILGGDITHTDWGCKVVNVVGYTVSNFSVWLIIAVTVERYIAICHPLRAPSMCNRRRALLVISSVLGLLLAINLHFFWTAAIVHYQHRGEMIAQCGGASDSKTFVIDVWPWVDAIMYSFLPFAAITVLNILIILQVIKARKQRTDLQPSSVYGEQRQQRQQESSYKLTVMLLTISFTFLLTTLPVNVSLIASGFYNDKTEDLQMVAKFKLVRTITELLMYLNHTINFFLYCATGHKFRQQLRLLLCRRCGCAGGGGGVVSGVSGVSVGVGVGVGGPGRGELRYNISHTGQTSLGDGDTEYGGGGGGSGILASGRGMQMVALRQTGKGRRGMPSTANLYECRPAHEQNKHFVPLAKCQRK